MKYIENAKLAKEIILSRDFRTFSMADQYRELQRRTSFDFSATIRFLEHLPVFMDGEFHETVRKLMAKKISASNTQHKLAGVTALESLIDTRFNVGAKIDLVADFAAPLWRSISLAITETTGDVADLVRDTPNLFRPLLSIRERKKINDRIVKYLEGKGADAESALVFLCLASLGTRPFVGSMSLSIYQVLEANQGIHFSSIAWPAEFPSSSLRYVDRIATHSGACMGTYDEGERVRCYTQSSTYRKEENAESLFGFGKHSCLGKSISQSVWKLVIQKFSSLDLAAGCIGMAISPHNDPFHMPEFAKISLSN